MSADIKRSKVGVRYPGRIAIGTTLVVLTILALWQCSSEKPASPRIALALSGGGYRATLHGLAALKALERLKLLDRVEVVSAASGGSITAGYYAYHRSRFGKGFSFQRFEEDLLHGLSSYEVPRTILTTEFVTAGSKAAKALLSCVGEISLTNIMNAKDVFLSCAAQISSELSSASLEQAIEDFTERDCRIYRGADALERCESRGPNGFSAALAAIMVGAVLGDDDRSDLQRMFCSLRAGMCTGPGIRTSGSESGHPFAELLHLTLYKPWLPSAQPVRMADLKSAGFTLLINATSNERGELWTASSEGAGTRKRFRDSSSPAWVDYGSQKGPTLADAVAASACYPLFCRPLHIPWPQGGDSGALIDGGVHDNLGLVAIRQFYADEGGMPTLLLVADAQRPFTGVRQRESRVDTILRLHDMLIDERSADTVDQIRQWCREGCDFIHVSLAKSDPSKEPLTGLPTDLRPIPNAAAMLEAATERFEEALRKDQGISRWLEEKSASAKEGGGKGQ